MRFVIAGGSGFLGQRLSSRLTRDGHKVVRLTRRTAAQNDESSWDPVNGQLDKGLIEAADVVVNLAGSPLAGNPYSDGYRHNLFQSRVRTTDVIARAIAASERKPAFLAQNGSSFYGDQGDRILTEETESAPGGILTDVTKAWQAATVPASESGARVCVMRSAPVLDGSGGSLQPILMVFRTGLAGPLGDGEQYFPVISLDDWVRAAVHLATNDESSGPYNLVAPFTCTNAEFTRALSRKVHRPAVLRAPKFLIKAAAGQQAGELLGSFRVSPARLMAEGFEFQQTDLDSLLDTALDKHA